MQNINFVSYSTRQGFASDNVALILDVLTELHTVQPAGINYMVIAREDGGFVHLVDETDAPRRLSDLPAFQRFIEGGKDLREGKPEFSPARVLGRYGFEKAESTGDVASAYVAAWQAKNIDEIAELLADEVRFIGPLTRFEGKQAVLESFRPLISALERFDLRALATTRQGALLAYDFVCPQPAGAIRMAEALTIKDRQIIACEMFFDPRPLLQTG